MHLGAPDDERIQSLDATCEMKEVRMGGLSIFDLTGKNAIVTGGNRGLGRGMALALARAGADVAVVSRTLSDLEKVASEIREHERKGLAVVCDVSILSQVQKMVEKVVGEFGRIDILVNSHGINKAGFAEDITEKEWKEIIDVQLTGTFYCCQTAGK